MEPIEDYSVYQREAALSIAANFYQGKAVNYKDVVETAYKFLEFLKGEYNG